MGFFQDIASFMPTLIGNAFGQPFAEQEATNSANQLAQKAAETTMAFQERMSNSAYQRATKDMVAAGINPALAITQGGASTPSGATASVTKRQPTDGLDPSPAFAAANGALAMKQTKATVDKIESDTALNEGVANVQFSQARNLQAMERINSAEATKAELSAKFFREHPKLMALKEILGLSGSAVGQARDIGTIVKMARPSSTSTQADPTRKDKETLYKSYLKGKNRRRQE